jgi:hypothetical protein
LDEFVLWHPEAILEEDLKRWNRIIIDPKTWTGEDIFEPRGLSDFIASDRFKEVCKANDVKNAYFIPAEEYAYDFYPDERKNWEVLNFDETIAILRNLEKTERFNGSAEALAELRKKIALDPEYEWYKDLINRFGAKRKDVEEALSKAYYKLQRTPW